MVLPLLLVGALGHWSVYAMNDYMDVWYDRQAGKSNKPLVSGEISEDRALYFIILSCALSFIISLLSLGPNPTALWMAAVLVGMVYNGRSKVDWFSALYLSVWAVLVTLVGAVDGGGITPVTVMLSLALAVHMFIMTLEGDIKDLVEPEPSIPRKLGCKVDYPDVVMTTSFIGLFKMLEIIEFVTLVAVIQLSGGGIGYMAVLTPTVVAAMFMSWQLVKPQMFKTRWIKARIVVYTILSATALMVASMSMIGEGEAMILLIGTVVWGVMSQDLVDGNSLYLP